MRCRHRPHHPISDHSERAHVLAVPKSQFTVGCPRIDGLFAQAPPEAWEKVSCGDGAKGPRLYHWAAVRLPAVAEFDYQGEVPHRMRWALGRRSIRKPDAPPARTGAHPRERRFPGSGTSPPLPDRPRPRKRPETTDPATPDVPRRRGRAGPPLAEKAIPAGGKGVVRFSTHGHFRLMIILRQPRSFTVHRKNHSFPRLRETSGTCRRKARRVM